MWPIGGNKGVRGKGECSFIDQHSSHIPQLAGRATAARELTVQCRTAVKSPQSVKAETTAVNAAVVRPATLSVAFHRLRHRRSYTATTTPPPAGNIGSTAGCL